jgi:hypothetical protein
MDRSIISILCAKGISSACCQLALPSDAEIFIDILSIDTKAQAFQLALFRITQFEYELKCFEVRNQG